MSLGKIRPLTPYSLLRKSTGLYEEFPTISLGAFSISIGFIEPCERFTYYGIGQLLNNCIQRPLPHNSTTGASGTHGQSGALGYGQWVSYALSTFKQFFFYTTPLFGTYLADVHWGRFRTICIAAGAGILAHIIIVLAALPEVISARTASLSTFIVGIVFLGLSTGCFKSNLAPFIVEQFPCADFQVRTLQTGEKVIVDPTATVNRAYMLWYFLTNHGALSGTLTMPYVEKYAGFWLAWLIPTIIYLICPLVLFWGRRRYTCLQPQSPVLSKGVRLLVLTQIGRWFLNPVETRRRFQRGSVWEFVKPSRIEPLERPDWMTFSDAWVEEIRRGLKACKVFVWYPLFFLCFNQINGNLVSQAAMLQLRGLPNEFLTIMNVPSFDRLVFPLIRLYKIIVSPIRRITGAFFCGAARMI
ncbi:Fc.00g072910.m01.CDS01 [Cosmosporella sp. VM-42]